MQIKYGSFAFDPAEATVSRFEMRHRYSRRMRRTLTYYRMQVQGTILGCTEDEISQRIDEIRTAFSVNGLTLALYDSNGNKTWHVLESQHQDVVVPPIVNLVVYPHSDTAEYATKRNFQIDASSVMLSPSSEFLWWRETVAQIGSGGAYAQYHLTQSGVKLEAVYPATVVKVVQSGEALGLEGYWIVEPFTPLLPTTYIDPTQTIWRPSSMEAMGDKFLNARFEWSFTYYMPSTPSQFPRSR